MKYFNSIVVAIAAVTVYADTPDLTGSLEFIANPQMDRWPNTPNARGVLDLQFYQGLMFEGAGETETNPGAPWIHSVNPYNNTYKFEYDPGTEAIAGFRIASWGDLLTSAQDPHEGDANFGHLFKRTPEGEWTLYKSVGGSTKEGSSSSYVQNNTHCWDLEEFDGRIFVSCYNLLASTDQMKTFTVLQPITNVYATVYSRYTYQNKPAYSQFTMLRRQMHLLRFANELYAVPNTTLYPTWFSDTKINKMEVFHYNASTKQFEETRQHASTILPDLTLDDFEMAIDTTNFRSGSALSTKVRLWHTTPFKGRVLYVGSADSNGNYVNTSYPLPLMGCSATVDSNRKISATRISFGGDKTNFPWDFAVVGDTVYALTTKFNTTTKQARHIVWKSKNGIDFSEVLSFDFHQNFISLEYRDGWFYFGAGNKTAMAGKDYKYDSQTNESGAIYRVRCPQEPVQVIASESELTIPEGESRTVSFRLSNAPASNMTLRVGATLENTRFSTDKSALTFTTSNWSTPQSVKITLADNDVVDDNRSGVVCCGMAGFDVERGEFCGPEATAGVIRLIVGDDEFMPPANGEIRTQTDFYLAMSFPDGHYKLMNDLNIADSLFSTIDEFRGTIDGQGHVLSGLGDGPICNVNRGTFLNLTLDGEGAVVKSIGHGVLCNDIAGGAFTNVTIKGYTIKAGAPETYFGLLCAQVIGKTEFVGCTIADDCAVSQAGSHDCSLGTFAGKISCNTVDGTLAAFIDCTNNASVACSDSYRNTSGCGGFVGLISNCHAESEPEIAFIRCVNNGAMTGSGRDNYIGGFVGIHSGGASKTVSSLTRFEDCVNNGTITTSASDKELRCAAGGFLGTLGSSANSDYNRCFNRGAISTPGFRSAAGFIGHSGDYATNIGIGGMRFRNCANYAAVTTYTMVGGILGDAAMNTGYATGRFRFFNCANYGDLVTGTATNGQLFAKITCSPTSATTLVTYSNCWTRTSTLGYYSSKTPEFGGNYTAATAAATAAAALDAVAAKVDGYLGWTVGPTGYPELTEEQPVVPPARTWEFYHEELNIPAMHAKGITGRGVRVGIVDGPINEVTVDGEKNLTIARLAGSGHGNGHGLSVASIIASKKFGIAPDCELYAYDVGNSTAADQVNKVLKGLWWCATNGCRVINMSFSFNPFQPDVKDLRESFDAEIKKICDQTGVILIASLGNNGLNDNPYFPQDTAYPICIGGITQDKQPTDLTKSWRHDFCAYGKQVPTFTKADGTVGNQDGTSFSAPMATGVAALLLQQVPTLTRDELYGILKGSAEVLAEGLTREYGWGLVRACEVPSDYKRQSEYDAEKSAKVRLAGITINNQNGFYNPENGFFDMTVKVGTVVKIDYTPSPANATDKRAYWYAGNTQKLDPILADDILRARDDASLVGSFATYTAMNDDYEELVKMRVFFTDQDVGPEPEEPEEPVDPPPGDPSVVYVAVTGSDSAAGTHAAPLLTISNAVARLGSVGGKIIVGPGTFEQKSPVVVTAAVEIVGAGCGLDGTVMKNVGKYTYGKIFRVLEMNHPQALLTGVVVSAGDIGAGSGIGGGGGILLTSGVVSNCVVRDCLARQASNPMPNGGGVYVHGENALLTHSIISNCVVSYDASWGSSICGAGVHVDGGCVEDTLVVGCHVGAAEPGASLVVGGIMLTEGTAENCTVVNCWGSKAGGICASPAKNKTVSVVNCVAFGCEKKLKDGEGVLQTTSSNSDGTASCFVNCSFDATAAAFADYANGDYRPAAGGVLVDVGAAIVGAPAGDLDGRPRVVGTAIDIGCFEWQEGGAVELETPVLSGSSFGFSGTGKFSIAVENPVRGAYYTVFTTENLQGAFIAESASVFCDGEALVLEMDASAPQKFAKVVISSSPFVKGSELP